jgi:hypothetical protein
VLSTFSVNQGVFRSVFRFKIIRMSETVKMNENFSSNRSCQRLGFFFRACAFSASPAFVPLSRILPHSGIQEREIPHIGGIQRAEPLLLSGMAGALENPSLKLKTQRGIQKLRRD